MRLYSNNSASAAEDPGLLSGGSIPVSEIELGRERNAVVVLSEKATRRGLREGRSSQTIKPFSAFLTDTYSRQHSYLRISVTERCNLRCLYCILEEGVQLSPDSHNLTTTEIVYLSRFFVEQGVTKIRLTGEEPTVRKDIVDLVEQIGALRAVDLKELCITTNGISSHRKLDAMGTYQHQPQSRQFWAVSIFSDDPEKRS